MRMLSGTGCCNKFLIICFLHWSRRGTHRAIRIHFGIPVQKIRRALKFLFRIESRWLTISLWRQQTLSIVVSGTSRHKGQPCEVPSLRWQSKRRSPKAAPNPLRPRRSRGFCASEMNQAFPFMRVFHRSAQRRSGDSEKSTRRLRWSPPDSEGHENIDSTATAVRRPGEFRPIGRQTAEAVESMRTSAVCRGRACVRPARCSELRRR